MIKFWSSSTIALFMAASSLFGNPAQSGFNDQPEAQASASPPYEPDRSDLIRLPDLNNATTGSVSPTPVSATPSNQASPTVSSFNSATETMRSAPLAWRVFAYNLAANKTTARASWIVPASFEKTRSYLRTALLQLGFAIKSAYPQAGHFLVVPADRSPLSSGQIIIVAQPSGENETALQMMVTGDSRSLDQEKIQQIPQVMLMVVQRRGLL